MSASNLTVKLDRLQNEGYNSDTRLELDDRIMSDLTASGIENVPGSIHFNRDMSWNNNSYVVQNQGHHPHNRPPLPLSSTKSHKKVMFKLDAEDRKQQSPIKRTNSYSERIKHNFVNQPDFSEVSPITRKAPV